MADQPKLIDNMTLFAGNSNQKLAQDIANRLGVRLGQAYVGTFSDGEVSIRIDENVRGRDVFILQSLSQPVNDHLMETLLLADALHRSSAERVTAVIPYYGYARQDRRTRSIRLPISARVVADLLTTCHINRVLTVDLHAEQIQGFFNIPVDNVYASGLMVQDIQAHYCDQPLVIVSPDIGGVQRARAVAKPLEASLAIADKRRPKPNQAEVLNLIGEVEGKRAIIIDDIVDTGGTLSLVAKLLKAKGATEVIAYATHAILSGKAIDNVAAGGFASLVLTDTNPLPKGIANMPGIRQISVAPLLADCIERICERGSISELFGQRH